MSEPLHRRIHARLRRMALAAPGAALPGEIELAARWRVSRSTVRQAFAALVAEGLAERRRRAGTVARPLVNRLDAWQGFRADLAARGVAVVDRTAALERTTDADAAGHLGVGPRTRLWRLERVRGDGDGALVRFISWFPPAVPLQDDDDPAGPLWERLDARGCVPARSREELRAVAADAATAATLAVAPGAPVLERRRRVEDAAGAALEWNIGWYRSDRFALAIDLAAR